MTPDLHRERDLASRGITATVTSDGHRVSIELPSLEAFDQLLKGTRYPDLCKVCWLHDATVCEACTLVADKAPA